MKTWQIIVTVVLSVAALCYTITSSVSSATWEIGQKFEQVNVRIENLDARLQAVESTLTTLDNRVFTYRCTCGNPKL